jgi:hypothetical protein
MTNYFKTKDDAVRDAIHVMTLTNGAVSFKFSSSQCDCGESQSVIVDDIELNKQVCNNIICETCHEQYG